MDLESTMTTVSDFFSSSTPFDLDGFQNGVLWIVIVGFLVALLLSMAVGANDVANSFGTSVGSKVLTLRQACILATIFELAGAALLGSRVSDTIRKGLVDLEVFEGEEKLHMLGNVAALGGSGIWQSVATYLNMPISGTHSTVGAVVGFSMAVHGVKGLHAMELVKIVISWFVSPVCSGIVSLAIFWPIRRFIIEGSDPVKNGLRSIPVFFGVTFFLNVLSVTMDGPDMFKVTIEDQPWFEQFFNVGIAVVIGLAVAVLVYYLMVPRMAKNIDVILAKPAKPITISIIDFYPSSDKSANGGEVAIRTGNGYITNAETNSKDHLSIGKNSNFNSSDDESGQEGPALEIEVIAVDGVSPQTDNSHIVCINPDGLIPKEKPPLGGDQGANGESVAAAPTVESDERPEIYSLFRNLQILSSIFGSFSHGGNDVANAIGPLIAIWIVYQEGSVLQKGSSPLWILLYGGVGISIGLWIWGRRVIKTMGQDLTKITPASGFSIEIGAALTVLLASKIGVPVSTTHCKVGSVVTIGHIRAKEKGVDWSLFRNIILSWVVTVPASAALSALLMVILKAIVL